MKKTIVWVFCAVVLLLICLTRLILVELMYSQVFYSTDLSVIIQGVAIGGVALCVIVALICYPTDFKIVVLFVITPFLVASIILFLNLGIYEFNNIYRDYPIFDVFELYVPWILVSYFLMAVLWPWLLDIQDTQAEEDDDDECATIRDLKKLATKNSLKGYVKRSELDAIIKKIKDEHIQVGEEKKV